ncbi:DMT family transporter [Amycolatopsis tucumanensis]|uniref:DMT family transporter n=1 Tax=Amycolatopsis tucumanensis TaxID=401106 RepID=A0ABP7HHI3_9PSEU|nr:DMT family transporter [Amycolatopsis tucumanensis]MCF6428783.1 DMT family transporter [Amycolatopsis tucumanensis]
MVVCVVLAVLAAAANAAGSVLQRQAARNEPADGHLTIRLLWDLAKQPAWGFGVTSMVAGSVLQALALAAGPIVLVQPILIGELAFVLVLTAILRRRRLGLGEWLPVAGVGGGVVVLLAALRPSGGDPLAAPAGGWLAGCLATTTLVAVLVHRGAAVSAGGRRALLLGSAAGAWFGFTAVLVSAVMAAVRDPSATVLSTWQFYAVLVAAPLGFFLLQNTLRAGSLTASQPGLTLVNPLVALLWGVAVFGENVRGGAWVLLELGAGAAIVAGTIGLARSPLLAAHERAGSPSS